jgi:hypothetical protein
LNPQQELGERGLSEAMDRLRERLDASGGWYQGPFTEALFWIVAIKDFNKARIDYTITEGKRLQAIGWARNYAAHELLTPVRIEGAGMLPSMLPSMIGGGGRLAWVNEVVLPQRREPKGPDDRRPIYQALIAGRSILEPLEMAQAYLVNLP